MNDELRDAIQLILLEVEVMQNHLNILREAAMNALRETNVDSLMAGGLKNDNLDGD
jgi:hypothetical protein